jgi:hypothetical protein
MKMDNKGNWEWLCACGHHNYSSEALREIADLLDKQMADEQPFNQ